MCVCCVRFARYFSICIYFNIPSQRALDMLAHVAHSRTPNVPLIFFPGISFTIFMFYPSESSFNFDLLCFLSSVQFGVIVTGALGAALAASLPQQAELVSGICSLVHTDMRGRVHS